MLWACDCAEHVFSLSGSPVDERLLNAITLGRKWAEGCIKAGEVIKASRMLHSSARNLPDPIKTAVCRAAGHAAATAHMADHSIGAALYALKAVKLSGMSVEKERAWQNSLLSPDIRDLVLSFRKEKETHFRSLKEKPDYSRE
jgi:hypothetical protein